MNTNLKKLIDQGESRQLELPEPALREALLNAIGHRDYLENANIQVYIFSDRIEITNPGGFPPGMTYADLGKKSKPRNYLLFSMMQRMGLVEKAGTGFLRIRQAMDEYELDYPTIEADENWFSIIFKRPDLQAGTYEGRNGLTPQKTPLKTPQKTPLKILTDLEKNILNEIVKNPSVSRNEIAKSLDISSYTVKEYLEKLKRKKIIERVGSARGGYWEVLEY